MTTLTPPASSFALRLKDATRPAHEDAEGSSFVGDLLEGRLGRDAYADLLTQTYLLYDVLERAVAAQADHPQVQAFVMPELVRLPSLAADLAFLRGEGWREALAPLPATARYVERLQAVAFDRPAALVAHHYLRYLGDLSGGQIIRRLLGRVHGLETDGVRFYIFDGVPKVKPFRDAYRDALDASFPDRADQAELIDEAILGFGLNRDVFTDLAALHPVR